MKKCEAKEVLYLPGLRSNLFSVNRVARSGLQVHFAGDRVKIVKNREVMAVGHHTGRLYELDVWCERRRRDVDAENPKMALNGKNVMKSRELQENEVQSKLGKRTRRSRRSNVKKVSLWTI